MSGRHGRWDALPLLGRYAAPALLLVWAVAASWGTERAVTKVLVALVVAGVLARGRTWPVPGLVAAFAGLFVIGSLPAPGPEDAALAMVVLACYLTGRHASPRHQPWAAAGVLLLLSLNLTEPGRDVTTADAVFPVLLTAAPWLLGLSVQLATRREEAAVALAGELDHSRVDEVRRATTEERLRIARDFHDVVAHQLSGLSLQAQVLRRRAEVGEVVGADDLRGLEQIAQQAMTDVRRLLGVLGQDGEAPLEPGDGLDDLPAAVERAARLGHPVDLSVTGTARPLPPAVSAAAYRIVQEALTNARRHGGPGRTRVEVAWQDDLLTLAVRNPTTATSVPDAGHGLPGIRERVRLLGGDAVVGPEAGEWRVVVALPVPLPVRRVTP